jgi:hypothetical protein
MIPLSRLSSIWPESSEGCAGLSVNSVHSYEVRQYATEKMLLEELEVKHKTLTYVTVTPTEVTRVTLNMCQVNIMIKKNVTICLHMKPILMEIM